MHDLVERAPASRTRRASTDVGTAEYPQQFFRSELAKSAALVKKAGVGLQ